MLNTHKNNTKENFLLILNFFLNIIYYKCILCLILSFSIGLLYISILNASCRFLTVISETPRCYLPKTSLSSILSTTLSSSSSCETILSESVPYIIGLALSSPFDIFKEGFLFALDYISFIRGDHCVANRCRKYLATL